jgi:hypothetical protein
MADQRRSHPLRIVANRLIEALGIRDAVDGATKAANESSLPQGEGGPADAYRHLRIAGELRRRFGPLFGAALADAYELMNSREGQSELNRRIDDRNHGAAIDSPDFQTFEDLQRRARGKISEAAPFNGDGLAGRVMWHRKPERGWQPDWSNVPLLSIERGGAPHHWGPEPGSGVPGGIAPADLRAGAGGLERGGHRRHHAVQGLSPVLPSGPRPGAGFGPCLVRAEPW